MDLIITLDYELFGDGSGDVFLHLINPTDELLSICDKYNIKITIFFEVVEYWKLQEEWEKGNKMGYKKNPANEMKMQIVNAFKRGHDIQLHIHPQWINAFFDKKNGWVVDNRWCLKDLVTDNYGGSLDNLVRKGKNQLEDILKPINEKYKCFVFRAGGFNILPSQLTFPVLKRNGFLIDTSLYPGGYDINELSNIDFRTVKNNIPYWFVNDNIVNQSQKRETNSIIEFPVFSRPILRFLKYDIVRLRNLMVNKKSAMQTLHVRTDSKNVIDKIKFFFEKEYLTWDYCLFTYSKMKEYLKYAKKIEQNSDYIFHPFVLIGHSKGFFSKKIFEKFLVEHSGKISFIGFDEAFARINKIYGIGKH